MKAKAKCWVNYGGVWHMGGETFEVADEDVDTVKEHVTFVESTTEGPPPAKPKSRGRPKKN